VPNGDLDAFADRAVEAARTVWDRAFAIRHILEHHTWDARAPGYTTA